MSSPLSSSVSPLVIRIIIGVVVVAWLASLTLDALVASYDPPDTIGLAFMAVLSAVLGAFAVQQKNSGSEERSPARPREEVQEEND